MELWRLGCKLVLFAHTSRTGRRLVTKVVTFNNLQRRNNCRKFASFHREFGSFGDSYFIMLEIRPILHCDRNVAQRMYSVSRKKRPKCFCNICNITRGDSDLIYRFPNKGTEKWCKYFLPRPNSVSTLPCETWNAHRTCATIEMLLKETP